MSSINITVKALDMASGPLKKIGTSMVGLRTAMMGLAAIGGIGYMGKEIIEASSNLEQMQVRLKALLGTAESGQAATRWIINFAENNPLKTIKEMEEMFKSLVNAGIKPTTEAMQGLLGATVKYDLSGQDLGRLTKALRQIGAMTNTQKQEMNQLSEQIPLFMRELASAMGKSQAQLLEDIKNRKVDSAETLNNVMMILSKGSAEAISDFNKTWEGGLARLGVAWTKLLQQMGATGFFDDMKSGLDKITNFVKDNTDLIKDSFGVAWGNVADTFKAVFSGIFDATSGDIFVALELVMGLIKGVGTLGALLGEVGKAMASVFATSVKVVNQLVKVLTISSNPEFFNKGEANLREQLRLQELTVLKAKEAYIDYQVFWNSNPDEESAIVKNLDKAIARVDLLKSALGDAINEPLINTDLVAGFNSFIDKQGEIESAYRRSMEKIKNLRKEYADKMTNDELSKLFGEGSFSNQNKKDEDLIGKQFQENIDKLTVTQPQNFASGWKKAMEDIKTKAKESFGTIEDLGEYMAKNINDALSSGFEKLFDQLKEGTLNVREVMMSLLEDVYKSMTKILAQRMAMGIVNSISSALTPSSPVGSGTGPVVSGGVQGPLLPNGSFGKPSNQGMQKVEIINNSGTQLQVTQAKSKTENGDMIMTLVLDQIHRNKNNSRGLLKAMMA